MKDITQLVDQKFLETAKLRGGRALGHDRRCIVVIDTERWRFRENPIAALVPGTAGIDLAVIAGAG